MCKRMIINAGISKVVVKTPEGKKSYSVEEWVVNDKGLYEQHDLKGY